MFLHQMSFHQLLWKEVRNKMIGQTLQIKSNSFFVVKKPRKKLPNSIITFFLIMQFMYGFNFGFIDVLNKKIRNFCKIISLLICLYTGVILLVSTPVFQSEWDIKTFWGSLYFIQYCGHIVLLYFSKYKVRNFITDLRNIDHVIIHSKEHKIGLYASIAFGHLLVITITSTSFENMLTNQQFNYIYIISATGLEAMVLILLVVNMYSYYTVIYLVGLVEREKVGFIKKQFLRVSECCEKFRGQYGNLVVMELFIILPKYLSLICNILYDIKENVNEKHYWIQLPYSIFVTFQMCAPAVIVEGINKQMESLRFKLHMRLMEERDTDKRLELSSLLHYMEQKPLYSKAWRMIPTDINVVVALFSFVPTYVIGIIQFLNIY